MMNLHYTRRSFFAGLLSVGLALLLTPASRGDDAVAGPLVFAAASMTDALNDVAERYASEGHEAPRFSFASSSTLAKQIAQGAPADLFISANTDWMDWLARQNAIQPDSRGDIARNVLVIVGPEGAATAKSAEAALKEERVAIGDPSHVPAGIYAKEALQSAGLWQTVESRAVLGENVRIALELVRRGEVARAIVYASDRLAAPELAILYEFPDSSHDPIRYPAAVTAGAQNPAGAEAFLRFLQSPDGQGALKDAGFRTVGDGDVGG
ncbi:molybdate ABC transporter substrate-binding protein [Notoacmeibacter ruber]|uniref:Molybdate ABC transporter substrate-binding protein n=1 Tax=Notoacmeibacter ruber TaxID=2670375 RepID=A0A3L7JFQ0_9HYPH|nr:molybdate ABC transporter substrate-binding protein [Notoacmeibacter ruber]RLQ88441.1 molybdate ABC transporter substrate-binding protein [Notoacmeibacter ruber]